MRTAKTKSATDERAQELQDEIAMGREMAAKLMGTYGDLNKRQLSTEYLNLIVNVLAEKTGRPELTYRVGILDTDEVNAFATPGGYILVTKGLLVNVQNEHELAGILGHEMGHINNRHLYKDLAFKRDVSTNETLSRLLSRGGANITFAFGQAVTKGLKTLLDEGLKPELEFEADQCGVEYAWASGYDPRYYRAFMARLQKNQPRSTKKLLKTHPTFHDRLIKIDLAVNKLLVDKDQSPPIQTSMLRRFEVIKTQK